MKLDEKYFEDMTSAICKAAYEWEPVMPILKQIAADAAEEQREKCYSHCDNPKSHTCFQCDKNLDAK